MNRSLKDTINKQYLTNNFLLTQPFQMIEENKPHSSQKIARNNRIFAVVWIVLEAFFCVMYGVYARTTSYSLYSTNGLREYVSAVGIALSTIIGIGGIMSYVTGLKWSGFGFALLITALCYQYYFLINAFWTKADVQDTFVDVNGNSQSHQYYGDKFLIWVSEGFGTFYKTFGNTATGAFKMALCITIAFAGVVGRAGPLEILIFVLIGGGLYELNRQIISTEMYDIGGSNTIFMFGGFMGSVVAIVLGLTKQKQDLEKRQNYTSSRFNSTISIMGAAFFWAFYPCIFLDVPFTPSVVSTQTPPFLPQNGMIAAYWAISTSVVTSLGLSALIHGKIRIRDLMYGVFAGAAMIGTSAPLIYSPTEAIVLGMIAGLLQPIFNILEQKIVQTRALFSTCVPFVFGIQGFLGSLACGVIRAIRDNTWAFNYSLNPYPFRWDVAGEFFRACFISFGIGLGAGAVVAFFVWLVSGQGSMDYFEDHGYWIVHDDGIRTRAEIAPEVQEGVEMKGVHSYIGGN